VTAAGGSPRTPTPARARRAGRLRRMASGQAGPGPALALAAVALLTAVIAVAGPRELTAARNLALRQQLATLGSLDTGITITAQWPSYRSQPGSQLPPWRVAAVSHSLGRDVRPPVDSPAGLRWASITMPRLTITDPPPGTILDLPPLAETTYLAGLARNTRLISGSLPGAGPAVPPGRHRPYLTLAAAVTAAAAARFHLRPGSELVTAPSQAGNPGVILRITGVIEPARPAAAIWQYDPVLAAPQIVGPPHHQSWVAGFFIGAGELTAAQVTVSGATIAGTWFYPLDLTGLTAAGLPPLLAGINALTTSSVASRVQAAAGPVQMSSVGIAANLGGALAGFTAQQQAVAAIDSLLIVGLVVAGLILLLVCARLAVDTHEGELALVRARGASSRQLGGLMLARTGGLTVPALGLGAALSVLLVPGGGTADSWLFGGIVAVTALLAPAVIAAWRYRRARPTDGQARDRELGAARPASDRVREVTATGGPLAGSPRLRRLRRVVGELTVVVAAAAALVVLRQRGTVTGADPFLSASPVLVAAAAGLLAARAYPALVRGLLAAASRSRGLVGFLGVATAARSRLGALLPALALVLTLTLAAFGALITGSVTAGQRAASWQQVGADVLIQARGGATIPAAGQRSVAAVAGIHRTAAVYTALSGSPFAGTLSWPRVASGAPVPGRAARPSSVGLVVADPARYAALAAATPWPAFPASLLARPQLASGIRAVPVLAADGTAVGRNPGVLELDGIRVPVAVVGRIGATPAMPAGGSFVVLPGWAAARFPSIHGPGTLLATGTPASLPALRAAVARTMPGSQLTVRRQVLAGLAGSPALQASTRLAVLAYGAAAALSVVALLFGFAVSARGRELLITRLSALGITDRQARALAVADTVPLLAVAIAGMLVAVAVLTLAAGPVLGLAVFTNSAVAVPVRPGVAALAVPVAAAVAVMLLLVAAERALSGRPGLGATLRELEVR
jgi:putative ABC transport system permease protein